MHLLLLLYSLQPICKHVSQHIQCILCRVATRRCLPITRTSFWQFFTKSWTRSKAFPIPDTCLGTTDPPIHLNSWQVLTALAYMQEHHGKNALTDLQAYSAKNGITPLTPSEIEQIFPSFDAVTGNNMVSGHYATLHDLCRHLQGF